MIKRISFFIIILMMISTAAVYSNTKLSAKHKYLKKNGQKIDCSYCHSGELKIEKKKKQITDYSLNGVEFSQIKSCAGDDCHN